MHHRKLLQPWIVPIISGLGSSMLLLHAYSTRFEPRAVRTENITIHLKRLPAAFDGFRIAHISDFHLGSWMTGKRLEQLMIRTRALEADMIVITGDLTTTVNEQLADELKNALAHLDAPAGVFAILGNHDHDTKDGAELIRTATQAGGVTLLDNAHVVIERDDAKLFLAGIDDVWLFKNDLDVALKGIPEGEAVILLAHEPDYAQYVALRGGVDLQLSGHTHGGQIRIPFLGAPVLPPLGINFDAGYYRIKDLQLYVNRGLGVGEISVRFNCPPEISLLTLRSGQGE